MLITRAGPHNYQPCADGARRRHEKLGKWICNGVADLICVRANKVRVRKELRHSRGKPPMPTKPVWQSWKMLPCPMCFLITGTLNCSIVHSSLLQRLGSASLLWAIGVRGEEMVTVTCFWSHSIRLISFLTQSCGLRNQPQYASRSTGWNLCVKSPWKKCGHRETLRNAHSWIISIMDSTDGRITKALAVKGQILPEDNSSANVKQN